MAKKMGRPEDYRKDFHPQNFLERSKQGKNITQIASEWDVHRDTVYEWAKKHPNFSDALKKGKQFRDAFWMNLGFAAMTGKASMNGEKIKVDLGFFCYLTKATLKWNDQPTEDDLDQTEVVFDFDPSNKNKI